MKIVLKSKQAEAVEYIVENVNKFPLIEAPTGFGKTVVLIESAIELQKRGYTVIVSTPNNKLTIDGYREAKNFYPNKDISFTIGLNNYIDINKLLSCKNSGVLDEYLYIDTLLKWEISASQLNDDELLFDDFDEIIEYTDIAYKELVKELICKTEKKEVNFKNNFIIYTNHFYLLAITKRLKNEEMKNMIILLDEVHELTSVAEVVFQNKFSPFFLKSKIGSLLNGLRNSETTFVGKKSLERELKTSYVTIASEFSHIMEARNKNKIGEVDDKNREIYFQSLGKMDSETMQSLSARIAKLLKKNEFAIKHKSVASAIHNEIKELKGIAKSHKANNNVEVFLSPSKGFPTYMSSKGIISILLKNFLWNRVAGAVGVSATLNTTVHQHDKANKQFAYGRLGIEIATAPEIKTFDRDFPKENVKLVTIPIKQYVLDFDSQEVGADRDLIRWANQVAEHIVNTYDGKRSLAIVGGFKEAKYIKEAILNIKNINVIAANKTEKTTSTIKHFVKEGGILIGTRNYGTGINLKGKLLERVYVVKLPYPQVGNIKWVQLWDYNQSAFWINFNNEMIMQLRQFFGRLQRSADDEGEIHLLDVRGIKRSDEKYSKSIVSKVEHYMSEYGVVSEQKSVKVLVPDSIKIEPNSSKVGAKDFF